MKKGLDENEPSFDELNPTAQKKTWVHTVLKGLIYGMMESIIRTASYGTGHTWYENISEVKNSSLKEIWELKELGYQLIADNENVSVAKIKQERIFSLTDSAFRMVVTVIDWDGAWKRRTKVVLDGFKKHFKN